MVWRI